jgi:hypothetical protein
VFESIKSGRSLHREEFTSLNQDFLPLKDGSGLVHTDFIQLLERHGLDSLEGVFGYKKGLSLHKPGLGKRERLKIQFGEEGSDEKKVVVYLKRFGDPGTIGRIKQTIRRLSFYGAGVHDFTGAIRLAENGLPVPRPVAYGHEPGFFGGKRSFAMLEELSDADALERILPRWSENEEYYRILKDKKGLIKKVAELTGNLHRSGFFHRDLYLSHIFLGIDRDGEEQLSLIDLQRIFKPPFRKRRWIVKDLAQLYFSSRELFTKKDMVRFLHEYFGCDKLDKKQKKLAGSIIRKTRKMERHARNRLKKMNSEPV